MLLAGIVVMPIQSTSALARTNGCSSSTARRSTGWRGYKKPDASSTRWRIEEGALTLDASGGSDTRGALDMISVDTYDVFELAWEWKIAPGGNSGLKYFVLEDRDAAIGHEYQMLDDETASGCEDRSASADRRVLRRAAGP